MISWKLGPVLAPEEFSRLYLERGFALAGEVESGEFFSLSLSVTPSTNSLTR